MNSIRMVPWACDRCGDSEDFPHNEQPLGEMVCLVPVSKNPRIASKFPREICGGTVKPVFGSDRVTAHETEAKHD